MVFASLKAGITTTTSFDVAEYNAVARVDVAGRSPPDQLVEAIRRQAFGRARPQRDEVVGGHLGVSGDGLAGTHGPALQHDGLPFVVLDPLHAVAQGRPDPS